MEQNGRPCRTGKLFETRYNNIGGPDKVDGNVDLAQHWVGESSL